MPLVPALLLAASVAASSPAPPMVVETNQGLAAQFGLEHPRDEHAALAHYRKAAAAGDQLAPWLARYVVYETGEIGADDPLPDPLGLDWPDTSEHIPTYASLSARLRRPGATPAEHTLLAMLMLSGAAVVEDDNAGISLIDQAAREGDPMAAAVETTIFLAGKGPAGASREAVLAKLKAAVAGDCYLATSVLSEIYHGVLDKAGSPSLRDNALAFKVDLAAASKGWRYFEREVALEYQTGTGVPRNLVLARRWGERAALHGRPAEQFLFADDLEEGRFGSKDVDTALIWYRRAALRGDGASSGRFIRVFSDPKSPRHAPSRAFQAACEFARAGNADAMASLGAFYAKGIGTPTDGIQAVSWSRRAIRAGCWPAFYTLGCCYRDGLGVPKDAEKALRCFVNAAHEVIHPVELAAMYEHGDGAARDLVEALAWYGFAEQYAEDGAKAGRERLERQVSAAEKQDAQRRLKALKDWREPTKREPL